jgi:hypothetical protein
MPITIPAFELLLFSTDPEFIIRAMAGGVRAVIVDLETRGKERRQAGFDTQINQDSFADIRAVKHTTGARVIARINGYWDGIAAEVQHALDHGADELLLPMVRTVVEVERTLEIVRQRCPLGILVETMDAVRISPQLSALPLSRVYVGLNDLAIDRKIQNIFMSVADGTLDEVRGGFHQPFGFAGLTLPDAGSPLPCRLLISENARLRSAFTFLRRSFIRDTAGKDLAVETPKLLEALSAASSRSGEELERDHRELIAAVSRLDPESFPK